MTSRLDRGFAGAAVAVPALYFGSLLAAATMYPGYSHARQLVSELGMPDSPGAVLFNVGIMAAGGCALVAALGYFRALRRLGRPVLGAVAALLIAVFGIAFLMGGYYPLPDERHSAYGLGLAIQLAPLFVIPGIWRAPNSGRMRVALAVCTGLMFALLAAMMGVGGLVGEENLGLVQRLYALAAFPWIGACGYFLFRQTTTARVVPA